MAAGSAGALPAGPPLASPPPRPGSSGDRTLSAGAATLWKAVLGHARCPPVPQQLTGGAQRQVPATKDDQPGPLPDPPTPEGILRAEAAVDEPGGTVSGGADAAVPATAKYCTVCLLWLNGPKQLESHQIGRDHRRWDALGGKLGPLPEHAPARDGAEAPDAEGGDGIALVDGVVVAGALEGRRLQ